MALMSNPAQPHLVVIGGTLRPQSRSRAAAAFAVSAAQETGVSAELLDLRELDLPMFVPDQALEAYPAHQQPSISRLLVACRASTAQIWCTPTYHGTVPGVFKNVLDFVELLADDAPPYLTGRKVGLIAINDSKTFGAMINCVQELRAWLTPTHVLLDGAAFDAERQLTDAAGQRRIRRLVGEVLS